MGRDDLTRKASFLLVVWCLLFGAIANAATIPAIRNSLAGAQLIVDGKPYLILGGELGNSSAGTAAQADTILPRLAHLHFNTVLMPVSWSEIEPTEGTFDFTVLDHWVSVAREQHLHLVILWFGSWKNGSSSYAPAWVKANPTRFPRAISADGVELDILSTLGAETETSDARAFSSLMKHLGETDQDRHTVLMVQVENEVGYLGRGRDRSKAANQLFLSPVPPELIHKLEANRTSFSPELNSHFNPQGNTWQQVFGDAADEVFMAWNYARYIQQVAETGKRAYPLPMYVNSQLPAPNERAGEYPSGGPHPAYLAVYRVTAPSLDFYSPDIYWPNFEYWIDRFAANGNPVFVPEARLEAAPYNAFYAYGQAKAFGFSPFDVDALQSNPDNTSTAGISGAYQALGSLSDMILSAQASDKIRGLVLHTTSPRPTQTIALGGYLFQATIARSWPARTALTDDGAMLIIQSAPGEFYIAGAGLYVSFFRDPDVDNKLSGIASIEQVSRDGDQWVTTQQLNGDQSDQGRQLLMAPRDFHIYRVHLYTADH
jgi:beta-galactosidase GanA